MLSTKKILIPVAIGLVLILIVLLWPSERPEITGEVIKEEVPTTTLETTVLETTTTSTTTTSTLTTTEQLTGIVETEETSTTTPETTVKAETEPYISDIQFDAPGDDRKRENWNDEWVEITGENVDMTGWTLNDEGEKHIYTFPDNFVLSGTVKVHSGDGTDTSTDLYWNGGRRPIWNNDGDTATLKDDEGNVIDQKSG